MNIAEGMCVEEEPKRIEYTHLTHLRNSSNDISSISGECQDEKPSAPPKQDRGEWVPAWEPSPWWSKHTPGGQYTGGD